MNRVAYKALRVLLALALILSPMQSVYAHLCDMPLRVGKTQLEHVAHHHGVHDQDLSGMRDSAGAAHDCCEGECNCCHGACENSCSSCTQGAVSVSSISPSEPPHPVLYSVFYRPVAGFISLTETRPPRSLSS